MGLCGFHLINPYRGRGMGKSHQTERKIFANRFFQRKSTRGCLSFSGSDSGWSDDAWPVSHYDFKYLKNFNRYLHIYAVQVLYSYGWSTLRLGDKLPDSCPSMVEQQRSRDAIVKFERLLTLRFSRDEVAGWKLQCDSGLSISDAWIMCRYEANWINKTNRSCRVLQQDKTSYVALETYSTVINIISAHICAFRSS